MLQRSPTDIEIKIDASTPLTQKSEALADNKPASVALAAAVSQLKDELEKSPEGDESHKIAKDAEKIKIRLAAIEAAKQALLEKSKKVKDAQTKLKADQLAADPVESEAAIAASSQPSEQKTVAAESSQPAAEKEPVKAEAPVESPKAAVAANAEPAAEKEPVKAEAPVELPLAAVAANAEPAAEIKPVKAEAPVESPTKAHDLLPEITDERSLEKHAEQSPQLQEDALDNIPQFYSKEVIYDTIINKRKAPVEASIATHRDDAFFAFQGRMSNIDDSELNKNFIWFRKLDQLALNILQISYTGSTQQRKDALNHLKKAIIEAYQKYQTGTHSAEAAYHSLKEAELLNRQQIKDDYNQNSWWKFSFGRITGSQSGVAMKLEQAVEGAEAIRALDEPAPTPTKRP
jgi:hypothetical protein